MQGGREASAKYWPDFMAQNMLKCVLGNAESLSLCVQATTRRAEAG